METKGIPVNFYSSFYLGSRFYFSSIAGPSQDKDVRVTNETVGYRRGGRGGIEDISPVSKRKVRSQRSGLDLMPLADDLEEQVRSLGAQR